MFSLQNNLLQALWKLIVAFCPNTLLEKSLNGFCYRFFKCPTTKKAITTTRFL